MPPMGPFRRATAIRPLFIAPGHRRDSQRLENAGSCSDRRKALFQGAVVYFCEAIWQIIECWPQGEDPFGVLGNVHAVIDLTRPTKPVDVKFEKTIEQK